MKVTSKLIEIFSFNVETSKPKDFADKFTQLSLASIPSILIFLILAINSATSSTIALAAVNLQPY